MNQYHDANPKKEAARILRLKLDYVGGWNRAGRLTNRAPGGQPHPMGKLARQCERAAKKADFIDRMQVVAKKCPGQPWTRRERRRQARFDNQVKPTEFVPLNGTDFKPL